MAEIEDSKRAASISDSQYEYSALERGRFIRLLQIRLSLPDDTFKLRCALESFDLDAACPDYDALSYTWGPPLNTTDCDTEYGSDSNISILLESDHGPGGSSSIGRNLYKALTQLCDLQIERQSSEPDESERDMKEWIWIDAICINQRDETEKSSQVAIMNEIYAKAQTVVAWLGPDDGTFTDVINFHVQCAPRMRAWTYHLHNQNTRTPATYEQTSYGYLISDIGFEISYRVVRSIALFYSRRRYLKRLWILQELALANSPFVLLGKRLLPFQIFADCSQWLVYNPAFGQIFTESLLNETGESDCDFSSFSRLNFFRLFQLDPEIGRGLFERIFGRRGEDTEVFCASLLLFLQHAQAHLCSDPRDRIFALLAIAKSSVPPGITPPLIPDYSVTYRRLYFETASVMLTTLPYLALLSFVDHKGGKRAVRRPSWIPSFGSEYAQRQASIAWARIRTPLTRERMFNASGEFAHSSETPNFTESELNLKGRRFDIVRACFCDVQTSQRTSAERLQCHLDFLLFVLETFEKLGPLYWNGQRINQCIVQTVTLDDNDGDALQDKLRSFSAWMAVSVAMLRRQAENNIPGTDANFKADVAKLSDVLDKIAGIPAAPTEAEILIWQTALAEERDSGVTPVIFDRETMLFGSEYIFICNGKGFFRTEKSFGLGPIAVQPDDEVWVLIPGRALYILRPTEEKGRYLFIGEAYVHGLMYGEAVEGVSEGELDDITLI